MKRYANFLMAAQNECSPKLDGCAGELSAEDQNKVRELIAFGLSDHLISCLPELEYSPDDDELLMMRYSHSVHSVMVDILEVASGRLSQFITMDYSMVSLESEQRAIEMVIDKIIESGNIPSVAAMNHLVEGATQGDAEYVKHLCMLCDKFPLLSFYLNAAYGACNNKSKFVDNIASGQVLPDAAIGIIDDAFVNAESYQDTIRVLRAIKFGKPRTKELVEISRLAYRYAHDEMMECQAIAAMSHLQDDLYRDEIMSMYKDASKNKKYYIASYVSSMVKAGA